ncbi:MAG TPA: hypothetical protein VF095_02865 [Bacillota bacterium]
MTFRSHHQANGEKRLADWMFQDYDFPNTQLHMMS